MKLPGLDSAVIAPQKIMGYLLSATHPNGRHKARYFASFGFSASAWEQLAEALIRHVNEHEVTQQEASPFGIRYVIDGSMLSPDRRNPVMRAVWFMEKDTAIPHFVTAYPLYIEGMMIKELDNVVLTSDLPEYGLADGDIGTVVMVHAQGAGYEVEFVALDGETIAVTSLTAAQIRPFDHKEIAHARRVAA